uniref:Uncharacterized protein n=1 Tax=Nothobranchius furzeri TaxID=105023 RepID=A0A1A8B879_NOTFU
MSPSSITFAFFHLQHTAERSDGITPTPEHSRTMTCTLRNLRFIQSFGNVVTEDTSIETSQYNGTTDEHRSTRTVLELFWQNLSLFVCFVTFHRPKYPSVCL